MSSEISVYDDFLPQNEYKKLYDVIMDYRFPWWYSDYKVGGWGDDLESKKEQEFQNKKIFSFSHSFYKDFSWKSPYAEHLSALVDSLKPISLIRIKANLTTITDSHIQYDFHRDSRYLKKYKIAIFYMNTNNGKTVFASGEEIHSVANRLIIFDSDKIHAGTSCTDESRRVNINFNYFIDN